MPPSDNDGDVVIASSRSPSSPAARPLTPATPLKQLRSSPSSVANFVRHTFWDASPAAAAAAGGKNGDGDGRGIDGGMPRNESFDSLGLSLPSPHPLHGMGSQTWTWADERVEGDEQERNRDLRPSAIIEPARRRSPQVSSVAFPSSSSTQKKDTGQASAGTRSSSQDGSETTATASASAMTTATAGTDSCPSASSAPVPLPTEQQASSSKPRQMGHARNASVPLPSQHAAKHGNRRLPAPLSSGDEREYSEEDNDAPTVREREANNGASTPNRGPKRTSLTSRSYTTLRNMAVAWVPGTSRSATPQEGRSPSLAPMSKELIPLPSDAEKQLLPLSDTAARRRPVKLDRRRLDKAVGLAVEAAQAAEEDERTYKERERRRKAKSAAREAAKLERERTDAEAAAAEAGLLGRIRTISEYSGLGGHDRAARLNNSLPWRRRGNSRPGSAYQSDVTSAENTGSEGSCEEGSESEGDSEDDNFSLSLYLSSLSYLLSALPAKEASYLPQKEREELRSTLRQVMRDIGVEDVEQDKMTAHAATAAAGNAPAASSSPMGALSEEQREERLRELLEGELRRAEARMLGHTGGSNGTGGHSRSRSASRVPGGPASSASAAQKSTLAGSIATSTLELTFAVAAAGVGLVGTGLSHFTSRSTPASDVSGSGDDEDAGDDTLHAHIVGEVREDEKALTTKKKTSPPVSRPKSSPPTQAQTPQQRRRTESRGLQWDLAMALASSTASTLYSSLSAAAEEAREQDQQLQATTVGGSAVGNGELCDLTPEDRLVALSASFARSLKRSPLPSQLSHLSSQLLSLLHSLDERYSLRKRATDEALRRTRQGLGYVRKRGWHVSVVRGAWAVMEMGVAGVEAWREDEEDGVPEPKMGVDLRTGKVR